MIIRYFFSNALSNGVQFISLLFISIMLPNEEFGNIREFVAVFLVVCALSQLGLSTSLISIWKGIASKKNLFIFVLLIVVSSSMIFANIYFSDFSSKPLLVGVVVFYSMPLIIAAMFQSYSDHNWLLFFQNYPKVVFYLSLLVFFLKVDLELFLISNLVLLFISSAVALILLRRYLVKKNTSYNTIRDLVLLTKHSFIPFLLIASTTFLQNFEFLLMPENVSADALGAFAKASLIFSGVVALLFFAQNKSLSSLADQGLVKSEVKRGTQKLFLLSLVIISCLLLVALFIQSFSAYLNYDKHPLIFHMILIKVGVWSTYAIPGVLVFHLGYKLFSLLLGLCPILVVVSINLLGLVISLSELLMISVALMIFSSMAVNYVVFCHFRSS